MKVSVIVPSYNHARYVTATIDSILHQTYKDIELIVVDDGSKDDSPRILQALAEKYGFRLVCKANEGVCKTLNLGVSSAAGELICFLASDDTMPPSRIAEQVELMEKMPDVDVIGGANAIMDDDGKILGRKNPRYLGYLNFDQFSNRNQVFAPTAMIRARVFAQYGAYDPEMVMEDYYMWLKVLSHGGRIFNTDRVWANYRIAEFDLERRIRWYYKGFVQTLTPYLPNAKVAAGIASYKKVYALKMAFYSGWAFLRAERDLIQEFSWSVRLVLGCVATLPRALRHRLLLYLLRNF